MLHSGGMPISALGNGSTAGSSALECRAEEGFAGVPQGVSAQAESPAKAAVGIAPLDGHHLLQ